MTSILSLREKAATSPSPAPSPEAVPESVSCRPDIDHARAALPRIVVVGGGAGGLELVTRLGDTLGRRGRAVIVLVDRSPAHLWKPLLHEVAAGSLDASTHQIDYIAQARWHHFAFHQGALSGLDRDARHIKVDPVIDEDGVEVLPGRTLAYDTLVLAIGSETNFFGVPGAEEHAMAIDALDQAEHFRRRLMSACMRAQNKPAGPDAAAVQRAQVSVVIIGAGATGVELAAELRNTAELFGAYGLHHLDGRRDIHLTLVEAGPHILGPLPERMVTETVKRLQELKITVLTREPVTRINAQAVLTASGKTLPADLIVWTAGIKVSPLLGQLGLPVNKLGQVPVRPTLQTGIDPAIFAIGDCASCPWPEKNTTVPPRAQAAQQQADFLFEALCRQLDNRPLASFRYHDHGSLISLGRFDAIGNLMGKLTGSTFFEGALARMLYRALYRAHRTVLLGPVRMMLDTAAQWLRARTVPRIKLH